MFYFIYKTKHKNGKYYIGRHQTKIIEDGYLGSGKWVKSIKNKNDLTREIICFTENIDDLHKMEEFYIKIYFDDPLCMNYKKASRGWTSEDISNLNRKIQENGKSVSQNRAKKLYESKKGSLYKFNLTKLPEDNLFYKRKDGTSVASDRVKNGTHNLINGVTCVDIKGNVIQISKEKYYAQTGDKNLWEFVCVASNIGKKRLNIVTNKIECINVFGEIKIFTIEKFNKFLNDYWVERYSNEGVNRENNPIDLKLKKTYIFENIKNTLMEKYGVDNPSKLPNHKEKYIETNKNKYGGHYSGTEEGKRKIKLTRQNDIVQTCEICGLKIKGKGNFDSHMRKHNK